jgi:hypothetical protein
MAFKPMDDGFDNHQRGITHPADDRMLKNCQIPQLLLSIHAIYSVLGLCPTTIRRYRSC